jgi:membrane associated rhomboid family serine protease
MPICPKCSNRLARAATPYGVVYHCESCGGRLLGLATLRRDRVSREFRNRLWHDSGYARTGMRRCPHCHLPMRVVNVSAGAGPLELDVCRHCQTVWFDPAEYAGVPHSEAIPVARRVDLPQDPRAREAAAMLDLERTRLEQEHAAERASGPPAEAWKWLPGIFGMPVEMSAPVLHARPWATWGLSAVLVAVFLATWANLEAVVKAWGFAPAEWSRAAGLTLLTSFFLHGGLFHLASNLYFFLVFGDNVEDRLGRGKFLLLLLFSHLAGAVLHGVLDPRGEIPLVGASAGISGVLAFYALAFPRTRLGILIFFFWWLRLSALVMLFLYAALQLLGAFAQIEGFGSVSSLGHLGGLAVGVVAGLLWRARQGESHRDPQGDRYSRSYRRRE